MKVRIGFVSNSSSSSFVCEICGNVESGWDMGLSDAEMKVCENGHMLCDSHFYSLSVDDLKKHVLKMLHSQKKSLIEQFDLQTSTIGQAERFNKRAVQIAEGISTITQNPEVEEDELEDIYRTHSYDSLQESYPACTCPICTLRDIPDYILVRWLLHKANKTKQEAAEDIRAVANNLQDLINIVDPE